MVFTDFIVKYDPAKDTVTDVTKRIIYSITVRRLKFKKPTIMFISGDSGEGKSVSGGLGLQSVIMEIQGLALKDYINDINVYTPIEYPQKLQAILENKELKKVNIICMHEAREIVKAKLWHSFLNQSIGDINAMSRAVKRLVIMIISQFIRDISTDIRYTINYYIKVNRPMGGNRRARLRIYVMWKDDRDLEKPRLRKRRLMGYLKMPNGRLRRYIPHYLEMKMPDKDIVSVFEAKDYESKQAIIKNKIDKLIKQMEKDLGIGKKQNKIPAMVKYYTQNMEYIDLIAKRYRGKYLLKQEVRQMHELTKKEHEDFQKLLNEKIKELQSADILDGLGVENGK